MPSKPLPKLKPALPQAIKPTPQMPWAGQRGTLEDLGSFGLSPEEFFGGGGRIMFSDTAPKLAPKQGNYFKNFIKKAFSVVEPSGFVGKGSSYLADSVGRVSGLPAALLVGQEKAHKWLQNYDAEKFEEDFKHLQKDPRLKNTLVRLGHADPVDSIKRIWKNKKLSPYLKTVGTISEIPNSLISTLERNNSYNPITDEAHIYSNIPEIAHHELGHARDINSRNKDVNALAMLLDSKLPIKAGPFTQFLETRANQEAEKGYLGDKKEFRRRLWPGRGTYWATLLGSAAMLHPNIRENVERFVTDGGYGNLQDNLIRSSLLGLGVTGAGALGGRVFAEVRNLFDSEDNNKKEKTAQDRVTKQAYIEGFVKRASEYGYSEEEALNFLKEAGAYSPLRNLDTSILDQNRPAMVDPQAFSGPVKLDRGVRDAFRQSNPYTENIKTPLYRESLHKLMNRPPVVNSNAFSSPISLNAKAS